MTLTDTLRATVADLRSEGRAPLLLAVAGSWFLALGMRLVFPAVLPSLRTELGIDNATAGALVTLLWMAYAVTQFPAGLLADRVGERRVLVTSMALGAVAVLVLGGTSGLWGVVAGVVLYGLGTGLFATPRVMVVSDAYADRAATALGVVFASGNVGNTLLPALAGVLAASVGWRVSFLAAAPLFVVAAVALRTALPDGAPDDRPATDGGESVARTVVASAAELRRRPVQFATAALLLFAFAYQGVVGFLHTYLVDVKSLSPRTASVLFGAFFASGLVAQLASGTLADAYGRRRLLAGTLAVTVAALVSLTAVHGLPALVVVVSLLGVELGFWPVLNAYAYDALSAGARGGGFGFVRTVYLCVGATGPLVVGAAFDADRYDAGFLFLAGLFAVVLVVCGSLPHVDRDADAPGVADD
ncbi:MAG: MFS transporter [Haloplanus sp.]